MTRGIDVAVALHPEVARLRDADAVTALLSTELAELATALGVPQELHVTVTFGTPAGWGDVVVDGVPAAQPSLLLMRAILAAGLDAGSPGDDGPENGTGGRALGGGRRPVGSDHGLRHRTPEQVAAARRHDPGAARAPGVAGGSVAGVP